MTKYNKIRNILLNLYSEIPLSEDVKLQRYKEYIAGIRKLAYKQNPEAQYDLAQHYEEYNILGNPNPNHNKSKRLYWYKKAAKNKNASAYNNLADLFERGDGCEVNLIKALRCYEESMKLGDVLGKQNYKKMLRDFEKGGIYSSLKDYSLD